LNDGGKSDGAFRTIGEVSSDLGVPQHILRYWETRFPQLRPLTRAGNRRYYRPEDVALVRRIDAALNRDGYTIRGVQKLLKDGVAEPASPAAPTAASGSLLAELRAIRAMLADALADDR
jgi:DNA-binding transcriptional MerR regulator